MSINPGIWLFFFAVILFAASFYYYFKKRKRYIAFFLLFTGALVLRIFVASDANLHTWDEKYHALVAKNMIEHPFKPTLYEDPQRNYVPENWVGNHVWLEKGPVPLLAMSFSMKFLGVNTFSLRIPSLLLSLLGIYLTFLIGKRLFDRKTAFLAAFFHAINGLIIELAGGRISSDHVETTFIVLVQLAVYFVIQHSYHKKKHYILLIGLFTALAFLSKWTPAFLVFPLWIIIAYFKKSYKLKEFILSFLVALLVCISILLPYMLYIFTSFPAESEWIMKKFLFAYGATLEEHSGPLYFYIHRMGVIFGELIYVPLVLSLYVFFRKRSSWKELFILFWILIPVVIFSFAETKRMTYLMIAAPAFFLINAHYWFWIKQNFNLKSFRWLKFTFLLLLIALPLRYCFERVKPFQQNYKSSSWVNDLKSFNKRYDIREQSVLFNVNPYIESMFYSGITTYPDLPDKFEVKSLKDKGLRILINDADPKLDSLKLKGYFESVHVFTSSQYEDEIK